jgi:hypothetical protein
MAGNQFGFWDNLPTETEAAVEAGAGVANRNKNYHESKPKHGGQRALVLKYLQKLPGVGATREAISEALAMKLSSVCGRVCELLAEGLIEETTERRETSSRRSATVVRVKSS